MKTMNFKKMVMLFAVLLFAGTVFQSCDNNKSLTQAEMEGYWVLKTMNGQEAKSLFAGALPTLQFDFENSIISGTGGCNRYHGPYSYKDGVFSAPNLAMTQMLCTEDNAEGQFALELSNTTNTLSIQNGLLTVSRDGKTILEFEKGTEPTKEVAINVDQLEGTWVLKTIDGVEAADKFKGERTAVPTISFDAQGARVSGKSGCNTYNAGFALNTVSNGVQLIISPLMSTRMACPNMEGEARFTQAIADTSVITMPNENVLQLAKNDAVLLVFEKSPNDTATLE
jgi:Heat shock protein